jgi:hypothetical protein
MASLAIGLLGDGGLSLLLLDEAIENDAQDSGARDGALSATVIKPLELGLGDHDGDGLDRRKHRGQPIRRRQVESVGLPLGA